VRLPLLLLLLCSGCFLPDWADRPDEWTAGSCGSHADCYADVGPGMWCSEEGECLDVPLDDRCTSEPAGLFGDPIALGDHLLLGSIFDEALFSGMANAAELAVQQANDRGGLGGRSFGLLRCTSSGNDPAEDGADLAAYLLDGFGVAGIVGPATSTRTETLYVETSRRGALQITPGGSSPALTDLDGSSSTHDAPGLLWRPIGSDVEQGRVLAQELLRLASPSLPGSVAVVVETGLHGDAIWEGVDSVLGGDALEHRFQNETELLEIVTLLDSDDWDAVIVGVSSVATNARFLEWAHGRQEFQDRPLLMSSGAADAGVFEELTGVAASFPPNVRVLDWHPPQGEVYNAFSAAYQATYGGDPAIEPLTAHAHDAGWMMLAGAAWSYSQTDTLSGIEMARGLRRISDGEELSVGGSSWANLRDRLAGGETVDLAGASGPIDFDPDTGETTQPFDILTMYEPVGGGLALQFESCWDLSVHPTPGCFTP
jgi:ABC-type branched-subunit amino acid transport system substrate-binding protein